MRNSPTTCLFETFTDMNKLLKLETTKPPFGGLVGRSQVRASLRRQLVAQTELRVGTLSAYPHIRIKPPLLDVALVRFGNKHIKHPIVCLPELCPVGTSDGAERSEASAETAAPDVWGLLPVAGMPVAGVAGTTLKIVHRSYTDTNGSRYAHGSDCQQAGNSRKAELVQRNV